MVGWIGFVLFALAASSETFDSALRAGLIALNRNQLAIAQKELESAVKLDSNRPEPWLGLAQTYLKLKKPDQAAKAASRAEALGGKNPVVARGLALYSAEAEAYYFGLAQQQLQQEKFQAATETLKAGLKKFPNSAQLELAHGVALYGLRRFPDAIDSFLRTIRLDPEVEQPYRFLGRMIDVAEAKLPAVTQAFAAYAKAQPSNPVSSFLYAKALSLGSGSPAEVEALLKKSIELNGSVWESHFELGLALERRRAFEEAAKEFERAAELNANEAAPHYRLARIYDRLGRTKEAEEQRAIHARLSAQR